MYINRIDSLEKKMGKNDFKAYQMETGILNLEPWFFRTSDVPKNKKNSYFSNTTTAWKDCPFHSDRTEPNLKSTNPIFF